MYLRDTRGLWRVYRLPTQSSLSKMPFHALDLDSRAEYLNHLLASMMFYRRFQSSRVANWVGSNFVPPCAPKVHSNAIENDIFPRLLEGGYRAQAFANHTIDHRLTFQ
jgi:hypothetical protein